jgi:hypothetical protein
VALGYPFTLTPVIPQDANICCEYASLVSICSPGTERSAGEVDCNLPNVRKSGGVIRATGLRRRCAMQPTQCTVTDRVLVLAPTRHVALVMHCDYAVVAWFMCFWFLVSIHTTVKHVSTCVLLKRGASCDAVGLWVTRVWIV